MPEIRKQGARGLGHEPTSVTITIHRCQSSDEKSAVSLRLAGERGTKAYATTDTQICYPGFARIVFFLALYVALDIPR